MSIRFHIPPPIVGKGRPRVYNGRGTTPKRTRDAEAVVAGLARQTMAGRPPLECPVGVGLAIVHPRPKTIRKGHRLYGNPGRKWCDAGGGKYPDADNVLKLVKDALNGIAYVDDRQVCDIEVKRMWGAEDEACGTWVEVWAVGSEG